MNNDILIEALEALVEKKQNEIAELAKINNSYFNIWLALTEHIVGDGGKKAAIEATVELNNEDKRRFQGYLDDNYDD